MNVTYLELGQNESFDFLLKSYVGKLPLDLMTAVDFESKEFSDRNALMRKQDKYVKRLLKGNSGVRSALDVMLKKPLANISKEGKSLNSSKKANFTEIIEFSHDKAYSELAFIQPLSWLTLAGVVIFECELARTKEISEIVFLMSAI